MGSDLGASKDWESQFGIVLPPFVLLRRLRIRFGGICMWLKR